MSKQDSKKNVLRIVEEFIDESETDDKTVTDTGEINNKKDDVEEKREIKNYPVLEIVDVVPGKKMIVYPLTSTKMTVSIERIFSKWESIQEHVMKTIENAKLDKNDYFYTPTLLKFDVIPMKTAKDENKIEKPIKLEIVKSIKPSFKTPGEIKLYWIEEKYDRINFYRGIVVPIPEERESCHFSTYHGSIRETLSKSEIDSMSQFLNVAGVDPIDYFFGRNGDYYDPSGNKPHFAYVREKRNVTRAIMTAHFNVKLDKFKKQINEKAKREEREKKEEETKQLPADDDKGKLPAGSDG